MKETIKPWTPVRSARKREVHMSHDGARVLCGTRMVTMIAEPEGVLSCHECYWAYTTN